MSNPIQIECSPGTFKRVQEDDVYRSQICDQVMKDMEPGDIVFTSAPNEQLATTGPENNGDEMFMPIQRPPSPKAVWQLTTTGPENSGDEMFMPIQRPPSPKAVWLDASVKLLLSLLQELQPKAGKSVHIKNKSKMWSIVQERMAFEGYNFSCSQLENKFRTLERQFKKTNVHNKATGRNRQVELNDLLGSKHSVRPLYTLDISSTDYSESQRASDADQTLQDDVPSCSREMDNTASDRSDLGLSLQGNV